MAKKSGQIAIEYMIMVGFVLAIILPLIILFYTESDNISVQVRSQQLRSIGERIVDKAESVYYLGEPTRITIKIRMPGGVQNVTLVNRALIFRIQSKLGQNDIVVPSDVNLTGYMPTSSGIKYISIESKGNYVFINST